jgi:hypothetical protein
MTAARYPFFFGDEPATSMPVEQRYQRIIDDESRAAAA